MTDLAVANILIQSNPSQLAQSANKAIEQKFVLPNTGLYFFIIQDLMGNGIQCGNPICYTVTIETTTNTMETLFEGFGNFTCFEQYYLGLNATRMQQPANHGCPSIKSTVYVSDIRFYDIAAGILAGSFIILLIWRYWMRHRERLMAEDDERRLEEAREIDAELERKLDDARKESILYALPKTVRYRIHYLDNFCLYAHLIV